MEKTTNTKLLDIINMFIILVYDVNKKRVNKVLKICRKYLERVQNSVFEGQITEAKLKALKNELYKHIVPKQDSICIYKLSSLKFCGKDEIGFLRDDSKII